MKRIILLLVLTLIILGCSANDKKAENHNVSKQSGIANTANGKQTNAAHLRKKRNFKDMVSPFTTKSPFEGTWLAEMRYSTGEITAITMRIAKVMKSDGKRIMNIQTRESKYVLSYSKNDENLPTSKRAHYLTWNQGSFRNALQWDLNDSNENAKYYRFAENNGAMTWTYNSMDDSFHWISTIMGNRKVGDLIYRRYSDKDFIRIKEHAKQSKYTEEYLRGKNLVFR